MSFAQRFGRTQFVFFVGAAALDAACARSRFGVEFCDFSRLKTLNLFARDSKILPLFDEAKVRFALRADEAHGEAGLACAACATNAVGIGNGGSGEIAWA